LIYAEKVEIGHDEWIKVSFTPLPELIQDMIKVPEAKLNPKTKLWAVPYKYLKQFEDVMGNHLILWKDKETASGGIDEKTIPATSIVNYKFKVKPFDFQIRGFNAIFQRNFLILADEMGLGKTFESITAIEAKRQYGQLKRGVVVCKASLLYNWKEEIEKFTDLKAVVITGTAKQRAKIFSDLRYTDDWTFIIISFETFRIHVYNLNQFDTDIGLDFLLIDEAQKIKSPESQIGRDIHYIPFKYKYLLTGTPLPNTPLEAYNYLKLGGVIDMNYWQFKHRYAILGGYGKKEIVGYKNIKELIDLIQNNMLRRLKKDKLKDLPDIVFKTINLEMTKGQKKLYNAVVREIEEDLKDTSLDNVPKALAKLVRLQQITDAPALLDSKEKSVKLEALDGLLEDIVDGGNKVIIFSRFRTMAEIMYNRYKKYKPAMIHGNIDAQGKPLHVAEKIVEKNHSGAENKAELIKELTYSDRQKEVQRFQNDPKCKIIIITQAAMEGVTLTAANYVICVDSLWSHAYMDQVISRAHRISQKNCVNVYYLVCKNTIDEKVMAVLERKELMAQTMLDKGVNAFGAEKTKEFIKSMF
jgi:SNF2 family DNA or RNA helicase